MCLLRGMGGATGERGGCQHWRGLQHARAFARCVGDPDDRSICVLKEEGGEGGGGGGGGMEAPWPLLRPYWHLG